MDGRYHEQLKEPIFGYNLILPLQYIAHIKIHWVFLNEMTIDKLTTNFKSGWESDEHITAFTLRLKHEKEKLKSDGIVISDVDKNQYYMLQIWKSDLFLSEVIK